MNNYKDSIKITDEQKETIYKDIIFAMLNSHEPLTQTELIEKMELSKKLNEYEIRAIYNLAFYIRIAHEGGTIKREILDFFNLSEYCRNDHGNLMLFVGETIKDIKEWEETFKERSIHAKWNFHLGLIFKRLKGYKPYEEFKNQKAEETTKKGIIINFQDWLKAREH